MPPLRGVEVDLTVDGFGSPDLSNDFISALTDAGVRLHVYEPTPLVRHLKPLRRLHRKIVVVDGRIAFVGGINFSEDHLESLGARAKQDYAVRIEGPVVDRIHRFARRTLAPVRRHLKIERPVTREDSQASKSASPPPNRRRCRAVPTWHLSAAITAITAPTSSAPIEWPSVPRATRCGSPTPIFSPVTGCCETCGAPRQRGVKVQLILQNDPDVPIARMAGQLLYESLMKDGVTIHEYCRREMHGKVAIVDGIWTTVGSTNLDPLSLSLNLEANVLIRDAEFAATLQRRLQHLIENDCRATEA